MPKFVLGPFYGGITDKKWSGKGTEFETLQGFDINTDPYSLTPNRSLEPDEGEDKAKEITNFIYADGRIHGLGRDAGDTKLTIYEKSSITAASWTASTGGAPSVTGSANNNCFFKYQDYVFGVRNTNKVWSWGDFTGTPSFTDTVGTLSGTVTFVGQGIHANDDNWYIPYNSSLAKYDGSTFTAQSLILPSYLTARCLENKGNYLAIACAGDGLTTNSIMYLWDMIQADVTERVDFGLESLQIIGNIGGEIVGVSLTSNSSTLVFGQDLVIKVWSGGEKAHTVKTIPLPTTTGGYSLLPGKFVEGDTLYFCLNINSDAEDYKGVWSVFRNSVTGEWTVNQETKMVNDTKITTINGYYKIGDFWFFAHSTDGSVEHTNNSATYDSTSVLESCILTDEKGSSNNKVREVTAIYEKLPASSTVTVQLSSDGGSYKTAISDTTTNSTKAVATKLSNGNAFDPFSNLQVKITSNGGAVPKWVVIDYDNKVNTNQK